MTPRYRRRRPHPEADAEAARSPRPPQADDVRTSLAEQLRDDRQRLTEPGRPSEPLSPACPPDAPDPDAGDGPGASVTARPGSAGRASSAGRGGRLRVRHGRRRRRAGQPRPSSPDTTLGQWQRRRQRRAMSMRRPPRHASLSRTTSPGLPGAAHRGDCVGRARRCASGSPATRYGPVAWRAGGAHGSPSCTPS